uniref:Disease resistance protein At4g27190-like leucine-rich repeats domain-containing protein n=1 Tax=Oryza rufipogon TaxID=4529 RepID=A0A0E0P8M3_ORYRU
MSPRINATLSSKRYLLVVENLYEPIKPSTFTNTFGLPPAHRWSGSEWVVSATSREVCSKSKSEDDEVYESFSDDDDIMVLIISALHQSAKDISKAVGQEDDVEHWHRVALRCFHYALLLFPQRHEPPNADKNNGVNVTKEELIRHWAAQGFLTASNSPRAAQENMIHNMGITHHDDVYQVGNIILQTFQDYSLLKLPFSPTTETDEPTETAAHFLAYHCLIVEHHTQDRIFHEWLRNKIGWIKLDCKQGMEDRGWHVSRNWLSKEEPNGLTSLILRGCSNKSNWFTELDHVLPKLPSLLVLDLSYTPLESVPHSVWCLPNIQFLSLRGCYNLTNLSSSSSSERTASQEDSNTKINLLYLDLSYSGINSFQCVLFQNMPLLQELVLVKCDNLLELPTSVTTLSSLIKLEVSGTQIKYFPKNMFKDMQSLQSIKLTDNRKLMDEKLEHVELRDLGALEELDLSATAIKELPAEIPNLPQLRQLLLMGVSSLSRFPWHKLQRFPDMFCLDCCAQGNGNNYDDQVANIKKNIAHVCIEDSRLFYSFNINTRRLVEYGEFFQDFYVQIAPCKANIRRLEDEQDMLADKLTELANKKSPYGDVYHHYMAEEFSVTFIAPPNGQTKRHVEISAMNRYPHGLYSLLKVATSISLTDDIYVSCLTDLSDLDKLEDCKLRSCHHMKHVFENAYYVGQSLRNVRVSQLQSLIHFYKPLVYNSARNFDSLKHLHLEYCPRLERIMPRESALPSLKTLDILFCYNLKTIFYRHPREQPINYQLPSLERMRLQELPLLQHLRDDVNAAISAPAWKELHVRGCWSLRRLPLLSREHSSQVVEVSGERAWWRKLIWDDGASSTMHSASYKSKLPLPFASFNERAPVMSYLR